MSDERFADLRASAEEMVVIETDEWTSPDQAVTSLRKNRCS